MELRERESRRDDATAARQPNVCDISAFRGTHVLITGGLGFIGSNLARTLVAAGGHVRVFDSLLSTGGGSLFNLFGIDDLVEVTVSNLHDIDAVVNAVEGVQYVFNLAGQSSHWDSMTDPQSDLEANCSSQLSLLECIRHTSPLARIVFASTRQIYGVPCYLPVDENHPLRPVDMNGIHKHAGERYHELYARVYGLHCTILRLTNTIGPRMRIKDARQTFAGLWIRRSLESRPFEVWGGDQIRDFTFVDDVVDALLRAATSSIARGRIYNLGSEPHSLRSFAQFIQDATGCEYHVKAFPEDRKVIDIGDYYADYRRIREDLGWLPRVSAREAVGRTIAYYRECLEKYV